MKGAHILFVYIFTNYMSGLIPNHKSTCGFIFTFTNEFFLQLEFWLVNMLKWTTKITINTSWQLSRLCYQWAKEFLYNDSQVHDRK